MPLDPQNLVVHIEIPQGSNIKYELDEENGKFMIDRIMPTTMGYPENYGLIEGTHGQDGDALDVLVFASQALTPNCHIKCKVIGLLEMEDEAGIDHKILAVPLPKIDMICGQWNSVDDIPEIRIGRMRHFFEHYKDLEEGKWVKLKDIKGADEAVALINESLAK